MPETRVQISDFSDRELMAVIADLGNPVAAREVALRIFGIAELEENEKEIRRESRCVISRFVWMRRYGLLDRDEEGLWRISNEGEALRRGKVSAAVESGIVKAKESSGLALANLVGEKLVGSGVVSGRAMQRELQFQITRRRTRTR
jgi:hypothetical protein